MGISRTQTFANTIPVPTLLQSLKTTPDIPDDDFNGTTLDGKWTVVDGSSGTVSLLNGSGAGLYQVGARTGWIMMQVGTASGDSVELRQDYTLPDGKCIVTYMLFAMDNSAATAANNEIWCGLGVNDNDAGIFSGTSGQTAHVLFDTDVGEYRITGLSAATPTFIGTNVSTDTSLSMGAFMRIDRSGLNYDLFYSIDGFAWSYIGRQTMSSAANNIWLWARCQATMGVRLVVGSPWIRQGTALAIDPWTV